MATRKDQLDAFNFARRRMVANLVVPTVTGSDEGAPRPVRTFAFSIVLSAIAVAAVAVLGVFKPSAPTGWQSGLAVDSNTGATYIYQGNQLHAVYNITSARLILGQNFQKFDVPDSTLNGPGIALGSPVGIVGAPEDVPSASNMNLNDWVLCQNESNPQDQGLPGGSTYLEIGYWPTLSQGQSIYVSSKQSPDYVAATASTGPGSYSTSTDGGLIVHDSENNVYLIQGDYKYLLGVSTESGNHIEQLLNAINGSVLDPNNSSVTETGFWVSDAWLSVFKTGDQITFPSFPSSGVSGSFGESVSDQPGGKVGEVGVNQVNSDQDYASVQTTGGLVQLTHFEYNLYEGDPAFSSSSSTNYNVPQLPSAPSPSSISAHQPGDATLSDIGSNWPSASASLISPTSLDSSSTENLCVGYEGRTEPDGTTPALSMWTSSGLPYGTAGSDFGLTQKASDAYATTIQVKPGYGLLARSATSAGTAFLIEDSGYRYALVTDPAPANSSDSQAQGPSAVKQLGYTGVTVQAIPQAWLSLIQSGPALDPDQAGIAPVGAQ